MIEPEESTFSVPTLSIVVTIVSDTLHPPRAEQLRPCLRSLAGQAAAPAMEVIVPHAPNFRIDSALRQEFPNVRFLEFRDLKRYDGRLGNREHHNELRARGIFSA